MGHPVVTGLNLSTETQLLLSIIFHFPWLLLFLAVHQNQLPSWKKPKNRKQKTKISNYRLYVNNFCFSDFFFLFFSPSFMKNQSWVQIDAIAIICFVIGWMSLISWIIEIIRFSSTKFLEPSIRLSFFKDIYHFYRHFLKNKKIKIFL